MSVPLTSKFFANARGLTFKDSASVTWTLNANTNELQATTAAGGGLTSVGVDDISSTPIYTITNSPLVANGTIHFALSSQVQKTFLAGPTSGANAQPTFRGLAVADLPTGIPNANLANSSVTVTAGTGLSGGGAVALGAAVTLSLTSPVTAILGGTGQTVYAVGDLLYADTTTTLAKRADVAAGSYLRSGGVSAAPVWSTVTIPNAAVLGDLWYGSAASAVSALAGTISATKQFLTQTGNGSISAAPAWSTIAVGDLPANGANPTASLGLAAVNGTATTWMRSDGAPALSQAIAPTWTAVHSFAANTAIPAIVGGINFAGTLALQVQNTSTTSAQHTRVLVTCGANQVALWCANENNAVAIITNGPTTPQACLRTLGVIPLVFGTSNTYRGQITSAGGWVVANPDSGVALTVGGFAGSLGIDTQNGVRAPTVVVDRQFASEGNIPSSGSCVVDEYMLLAAGKSMNIGTGGVLSIGIMPATIPSDTSGNIIPVTATNREPTASGRLPPNYNLVVDEYIQLDTGIVLSLENNALLSIGLRPVVYLPTNGIFSPSGALAN